MRALTVVIFAASLVAAAPGAGDIATWYGIRLGASVPVAASERGITPNGADAILDAPKPWDAAIASTNSDSNVTGLSFFLYGAEVVSDVPDDKPLPRRRSVASMRAIARNIEADLRRRLGAPNRAPEFAGGLRWASTGGATGTFHTASFLANDDIITLIINAPELPNDTMEANP
jgi:hypothetical protein